MSEVTGVWIDEAVNLLFWKAGMVANVGGIEAAWRRYGPAVAAEALAVLGAAFPDQVLSYAGSIYPGIAAVCAAEMGDRTSFPPGRLALFIELLEVHGQGHWRQEMMRVRMDNPGMTFAGASVAAVLGAWNRQLGGELPPKAPAAPAAPVKLQFAADGKTWCTQCDARVTQAEMQGCKSQYCAVRKVA